MLVCGQRVWKKMRNIFLKSKMKFKIFFIMNILLLLPNKVLNSKISIIALGAQRETRLVTFLVCFKNYKHLRRIKKDIDALCLAESKGADGSLEAVDGTGQGNNARYAIPHSHGRWEEGVLEAVDAGGRLDVSVRRAHSWLKVRLGGDSN